MSSDHHFAEDYFQPEFYHFSEDSLFLVKTMIDDLGERAVDSIFDLGAGCGVVGIELAIQLKLKQLFFCEKQPLFRDYLEQNIKKFIDNDVSTRIFWGDWSDLDFHRSVPLIASNPPFYLEEHHRPSPQREKQSCRQWSQKNCHVFCDTLEKLLSDTGRAYLLTPIESQTTHLFFQIFDQMGLSCRTIAQKNTYQVLRVLRLNVESNEIIF